MVDLFNSKAVENTSLQIIDEPQGISSNATR
jgi:hypothetical protein